MKKFIKAFLVILIILFAYEYQKPVLTSKESLEKAISCVSHPPAELAVEPVDAKIEDLQTIQVSIQPKDGLFNRLTHQREMYITLGLKGKNPMTPMVQLDAYTGKCLRIIGPME
ncbi:hypothetical protein [Falsibacillus pallidus]|uniref:hypothetical protein n=1 Tax=Falsibacillus pallidus TaxID=493781 RepID=UPI003D9799AC